MWRSLHLGFFLLKRVVITLLIEESFGPPPLCGLLSHLSPKVSHVGTQFSHYSEGMIIGGGVLLNPPTKRPLAACLIYSGHVITDIIKYAASSRFIQTLKGRVKIKMLVLNYKVNVQS